MPPTIRLPRNPAVLRALQRVAAIPSHDGPRPRRDAAAAATARSASRRVDADGRAGWRSGAAWRAVAGDGRRGLAGGRGGIVQARKDENDAAKGEEEGKVAVDAKPLLEQHGFMLVEDQAKEVLRIDYVQRVNKLVAFKLRMPFPRYDILRTPREDNSMIWEIEASAAGRRASATGSTKKGTMQDAAKSLLEKVQFGDAETRKIRKADDVEAQKAAGPVVQRPANPEWLQLPAEHSPFTAIEAPYLSPVPLLAHGLHDVLRRNNAVATTTDVAGGGAHKVVKYLKKIVQPPAIDWKKVEGFVPPSQDERLQELSKSNKARFKASTSSITSLLGHIYQVVSNFKPVDTSDLSESFKGLPKNFSFTLMKKPVGVMLRYNDGVYGIDSDGPPGEKPNQILIDLGKSMERMLTLSEGEFSKLLLKPLGGGDAAETVEELGNSLPDEVFEADPGAYNYSLCNEFMLRSQLDCIYGKDGNAKIFDLKTRATHAIRNCFHVLPDVPAPERHLHFIDYKIVRQKGLWYSFEREIYDMIRSAFLKYSTQLRIGRMHGAFVTYHNTLEIFGFQYVPLTVMDRLVYGSTHLANTHFDQGTKMLAKIMDQVIEAFPGNKDISLTMTPNVKTRHLRIEAKVLLEESIEQPPEGMEHLDPGSTKSFGPSTAWIVFVQTTVDGKLVEQPWDLTDEQTLGVEYFMVLEKDVAVKDKNKHQALQNGPAEEEWHEPSH